MALIDIVVAVRNEEESLPIFLANLASLSLPAGIELGCVFVEDGSTDHTRQILRNSCSHNSRIKYIFLQEGRGQAPAIALGISKSQADAVIMMDVDGGHPPDLIPIMVEEFLAGAQAVQAVRRKINERSRYRDIGTFVFNRAYRLVSGIDTEKQNVYYRLLARPIFKNLVANNRWKHFLRINYHSYPATQVSYVYFDATERLLGMSKYNFRRLVRFAWTAVLSSMSTLRFSLCVSAALLGCAILTMLGWFAAATFGTLLISVVVVQFVRMSRHDVLSTFTIQDSNV